MFEVEASWSLGREKTTIQFWLNFNDGGGPLDCRSLSAKSIYVKCERSCMMADSTTAARPNLRFIFDLFTVFRIVTSAFRFLTRDFVALSLPCLESFFSIENRPFTYKEVFFH